MKRIKMIASILIMVLAINVLLPIGIISFAIDSKIQGDVFKQDVNEDGKIDIVDLSSVATTYNSIKDSEGYNEAYDIDGNDIIDIYDMVSVSSKIGSASIPYRVYDLANEEKLIGRYNYVEDAISLAESYKSGYILDHTDKKIWSARYEWYVGSILNGRFNTLDEAIKKAEKVKDSVIKDSENGDKIVWQYKKKIVLDPGHGGKDPGALGPTGLKEKDVVLKVALKVKRILEDRGYDVIMTRESDIYLTLEERTQISNKSGGELFVSIHTNAYNAVANGIETFGDPTVSKSWSVANNVQNSLVSYLGLRNRGRKDGSELYVIRKNNVPAILTEIAFISNPNEEALLKSDEFLTKAAEAIVVGIEKSF